LDRAQKEIVVKELDEIFISSGTIVVAHYSGLTVSDMSDLRLRMRNAGGLVRVAKNRLVKIALKDKVCSEMSSLFNGQTLMMCSEDPVTAAKIAVEFSNDNDNLVILGGSMGEKNLNADEVIQVSKMPSREELISSIVSCIGSPSANLAGLLSSPSSNIYNVLNVIEKEKAA
tara:strand:- start:156 stop:671 length:516 start_codon:yes stop_codon:yes gene_type:complete